MEDPTAVPSKKRLRVDSVDSDSDSAEVKRIRDDLLDLLDDSDPDPAVQDLDSVIQSFAEEISPASSPPPPPAESVPELGYLLLASDDELGLPPSDSASTSASHAPELARASSEIGEVWGFEVEDPIPSYDSFELEERYYGGDEPEYVGFEEGLFEHSDVYSVFS